MLDSTLTAYARNILATFEARLQTWRHPSVCWDNKPCHFYDTQAFEAWMERTEEGENKSNTQLLLNALGEKLHGYRMFGRQDIQILNSHNRCVKVFGVLLEQKRGELIEFFKTTGIVDQNLTSSESISDLRDTLRAYHVPNPDNIIEAFEKAKWAFCPAQLSWNMESNFERGHYILPFCRKRNVNEKGGQATVVQVAVQKEFVPEEWHKVLSKAAYMDDEFGECYRMAIKIFADERRITGAAEKEALAGLFVKSAESGEDELLDNKPFVRYLGYFSHTEEMNGRPRKTYNLLLEYGDLDLDEYFAVTEPPTGYDEIFSFWKSLFRIADALKEVHQFSFDEHHRYLGIHGDVKPDNILVVDNEFKLADFGYANFVKKEDRQEGPTHVLSGGTLTFGPPEGTKGKVTQSFDIWSFATVLLISATWVILGREGPARFEILRELAIKALRLRSSNDHRLPAVDDAFHDGERLLPEIREWIAMLKERRRLCDTVTGLVLELAETHMLKEIKDRIVCNELCDKLEDLLAAAETRRKRMFDNQIIRRPEEEPSPFINQSLTAYERGLELDTSNSTTKAVIEDEKKTKVDTREPIKSTSRASAAQPLRRSIQKSTRIGKTEILNQIPMSRTAHREELLKRENRDRGKAPYEEPTAAFPGIPRSDDGADIPGPSRSLHIRSVPPGATASTDLASNFHEPQKGHFPAIQTFNLGTLAGNQPLTRSSRARHFSEPSTATEDSLPALGATSIQEVPQIELSPPQDPSTPEKHTQNPKLRDPKDTNGTDSPETKTTSHYFGLPPDLTKEVEEPPEDVSMPTKRSTFPPVEESNPIGGPVNPPSSPPILRSSFETLQVDKAPRVLENKRIESTSIEKEVNLSSRSPSPSPSFEIPASLRGLQYDIFNTRWALDRKKPKTKTQKVMGIFKKAQPDEHLKRFIVDRDMVLVVDNSSSMRRFQYAATFVVETLARKLQGIDKNGLDLKFTIGERQYDVDGAGKEAPNKFRNAMFDAWPKDDVHRAEKTDMSYTLGQIFSQYRKTPQKQMTLIIVTDGIWDCPLERDVDGNIKPDKLEAPLVTFMEHIRRIQPHEKRWFTIQFLQLGEDQNSTERLRRFDDDLEEIYKKNKFPDVIDHVHWTGSVDKMILGSVRDYDDEKASAVTDDPLLAPPPNINKKVQQFYEEKAKRSSTLGSARGLSFQM